MKLTENGLIKERKEGYIVGMIGMIVAQVKNLRSQVGRAAVHVMAALFEQVVIIANISN